MKRSDFLSEVAKAAGKAQRRRRRMRTIHENSLDALTAARAEDPARGVRAARQVPRCGKIKKSDGRPCRAPRIRGASKCRWHGGLREVPNHPGNVRRYLGGAYARQQDFKIRMRRMTEDSAFAKLDQDQRAYLERVLDPNDWQDDATREMAALHLIDAHEHGNVWGWGQFIVRLAVQRKARR